MSSRRNRGRRRRNSMWIYDVHRTTNMILNLQERGVLKLQVPTSQLQIEVEQEISPSCSDCHSDLQTLEEHDLDQSYELPIHAKLSRQAASSIEKENVPEDEKPVSVVTKSFSGKDVTVLKEVENIHLAHKVNNNTPLLELEPSSDATSSPHGLKYCSPRILTIPNSSFISVLPDSSSHVIREMSPHATKIRSELKEHQLPSQFPIKKSPWCHSREDKYVCHSQGENSFTHEDKSNFCLTEKVESSFKSSQKDKSPFCVSPLSHVSVNVHQNSICSAVIKKSPSTYEDGRENSICVSTGILYSSHHDGAVEECSFSNWDVQNLGVSVHKSLVKVDTSSVSLSLQDHTFSELSRQEGLTNMPENPSSTIVTDNPLSDVIVLEKKDDHSSTDVQENTFNVAMVDSEEDPFIDCVQKDPSSIDVSEDSSYVIMKDKSSVAVQDDLSSVGVLEESYNINEKKVLHNDPSNVNGQKVIVHEHPSKTGVQEREGPSSIGVLPIEDPSIVDSSRFYVDEDPSIIVVQVISPSMQESIDDVKKDWSSDVNGQDSSPSVVCVQEYSLPSVNENSLPIVIEDSPISCSKQGSYSNVFLNGFASSDAEHEIPSSGTVQKIPILSINVQNSSQSDLCLQYASSTTEMQNVISSSNEGQKSTLSSVSIHGILSFNTDMCDNSFSDSNRLECPSTMCVQQTSPDNLEGCGKHNLVEEANSIRVAPRSPSSSLKTHGSPSSSDLVENSLPNPSVLQNSPTDVPGTSTAMQYASSTISNAVVASSLTDAALDKYFLEEYICEPSSSLLLDTSMYSRPPQYVSSSTTFSNDKHGSIQSLPDGLSVNQSPQVTEPSSDSCWPDNHLSSNFQHDLISKFSTTGLSDTDSKVDRNQWTTDSDLKSSTSMDSKRLSKSTRMHQLKTSLGDFATSSLELHSEGLSDSNPVDNHCPVENKTKVETDVGQTCRFDDHVEDLGSNSSCADMSLTDCESSNLFLRSPAASTNSEADCDKEMVELSIGPHSKGKLELIRCSLNQVRNGCSPVMNVLSSTPNNHCEQNICGQVSGLHISLTSPVQNSQQKLYSCDLQKEQRCDSKLSTLEDSVVGSAEANTLIPQLEGVSNFSGLPALDVSLKQESLSLEQEDNSHIAKDTSSGSTFRQAASVDVGGIATKENIVEEKIDGAEVSINCFDHATPHVTFSTDKSVNDSELIMSSSVQSPAINFTSSEDESDVEKLEQLFSSISQSRVKSKVQKKHSFRNPVWNLCVDVGGEGSISDNSNEYDDDKQFSVSNVGESAKSPSQNSLQLTEPLQSECYTEALSQSLHGNHPMSYTLHNVATPFQCSSSFDTSKHDHSINSNCLPVEANLSIAGPIESQTSQNSGCNSKLKPVSVSSAKLNESQHQKRKSSDTSCWSPETPEYIEEENCSIFHMISPGQGSLSHEKDDNSYSDIQVELFDDDSSECIGQSTSTTQQCSLSMAQKSESSMDGRISKSIDFININPSITLQQLISVKIKNGPEMDRNDGRVNIEEVEIDGRFSADQSFVMYESTEQHSMHMESQSSVESLGADLTSSEDENDNEKLEQLFSSISLQSRVKSKLRNKNSLSPIQERCSSNGNVDKSGNFSPISESLLCSNFPTPEENGEDVSELAARDNSQENLQSEGNNDSYSDIKKALFSECDEVCHDTSVTEEIVSKVKSDVSRARNVSCDEEVTSSEELSASMHCSDFKSEKENLPTTRKKVHISLLLQSTPCDTSSEDEDDNEKLEEFFSSINSLSRIQSKVKRKPSISVFDFTVSDTEDIDCKDESNGENHLEGTPPTYSTPHMPDTGVMFWGSPNAHQHKCKAPETGKKPLPHATPSNTCIYKYNTPFTEKKPLPFVTPTVKFNTAVNMKSVSIRSGRKSLTGCKESYFTTPFRRAPPPLDILTTPSSTKYFPRFKSNMVQELFQMFNETVFENKLPADMEVLWNKKLRTTAGYCYYVGTSSSRVARIELSCKVVDSYERLRSTLVHEMCHAATWIVDGDKSDGHGPLWKAWSKKVHDVHPGLEPVSVCHGYQIQYRHYYKCVKCKFQIGRHSKSINLRTARCTYCGSYLEYVPRLKADGTPMKLRTPNKFAVFVKENYNQVKSNSPWRSHNEIMKKISTLYGANK